MKTLALILFLASPAVAQLNYHGYESAEINQEFDKIYYQLKYPNIINGRASTMTVVQLNVSTVAAVGLITASSMSATHVSGSTATFKYLVGTTTNDNAPEGNYGHHKSSVAASANFTTTNQYADLAALTLTAGDWDLSGAMACGNVANFTASRLGISENAGNSTVGLVLGDNLVINAFASNTQSSLTIPSYRVSIAATTTYYLKFLGNYTGTVPTASGRLSARRAR